MLYVVKGVKHRDLKSSRREVRKSYRETYSNYLKILILTIWIAFVCLGKMGFLSFFGALSCWWTKAQRTGSGEWMMLLSISMVIPGQPCQWLEFSPCHIFQELQFIVSAAYFIRIIVIFILKYPKRWKILVPSLHLSPVSPFLHLPLSRKQTFRVANLWVEKYWFHAN